MKEIPDIIDNTDYKLADILNALISENSEVYIATGYFNIESFKLVKDAFKKAKKVKILIGKALSPENVISSNTLELILQEEIEENIDKKEEKKLLDELVEFLKSNNVDVRIYKNGFFHGKFYVIKGGIPTIGSIGIVGSSNFTYAGLTSNTEFNGIFKQLSAVESLIEKFNNIFNADTEDYKSNLLSLISSFHSQYPPYEVYMKILYSYFEDKLSESPAESPAEDISSPIFLANFQRDGYLSALQALEKYGGVILADSVGLGKTYLALRLLDDFAYKLRQKALIICPAQIKDTLWYPKLREYNISAEIVTQEKVSREFNPDRFSDYDLIVIDESHNFRNSNTKRWKNLFESVVKGKNKKVILITATPVNNSVFDLYNQIRFITKDNDEYFKSTGITSLWGYFLKADRDKETLFDLLEEIAVRRSRQFIKKYYPEATIDGEKIKFPERQLYTVKYKLTDVYAGIYEECKSTIESLNLASYNIDAFRKDIFRKKLENFNQLKDSLMKEGWSEEDINQLLMNLGRNEAIIAILKVLFLKRLESSVEAFRISVERLLNFQRKFLEFLEKGKILDRETYRKFYIVQSEDENEESIDELYSNLQEINPDEYELEEIKNKTREDIKNLENLHEKLLHILQDKDSKLQQLIKMLQSLKGRKIVIFGYFKDTMRYIYKYLKQPVIVSKIGVPVNKISIVDSDVSPKDRNDRIIRFSPVSNSRPEIKGTDEEIQILISTDVLSEGQNLQDADTVINYDLPWNPIRIVQRIGRLDRLGSPYDFIHVYNFFPEDELESILNLLKRLYEKIDKINRSVGLDASVLGEMPNPKDFGYIKDIFESKKEVIDELEKISEIAIGEFLKEEILKYLKSEGAKKIQKIPNGVGSGIRREGKKGVFVALKNGERNYWCFYDLENDKIIDNKLECIRLIRCDKDEPYVPPPPDLDVYQIIKKVKNYIISKLKTAEVKPTKLKAPQNHIINWLQSIGSEKAKHLISYYSNPLPDAYLKELKKLWNLRNLKSEDIIKKLEDFMNSYPLLTSSATPPKDKDQKEIKLKLVGYITVTS